MPSVLTRVQWWSRAHSSWRGSLLSWDLLGRQHKSKVFVTQRGQTVWREEVQKHPASRPPPVDLWRIRWHRDVPGALTFSRPRGEGPPGTGGHAWLIIRRLAQGFGGSVSITVRGSTCRQLWMKTYRVTEIAPHTGDDSCSRISESPPQRTPLDLEACVNNGNVFFNHFQPNKKKNKKTERPTGWYIKDD